MKKLSLLTILVGLPICLNGAAAYQNPAYLMQGAGGVGAGAGAGAGARNEDEEFARALQMSLDSVKNDVNEDLLKKAKAESLELEKIRAALNSKCDASVALYNRTLERQLRREAVVAPAAAATNDKLEQLKKMRLQVVEEYRKAANSFIEAMETGDIGGMQKMLEVEILKREVNTIQLDDEDCNFLIHAVFEAQSIKALKLLLTIADINVLHNKSGKTLLQMAIELDNSKLVQWLLNNNANANIKDRDGVSTMDYAIQSKNNRMIQLIQEKSGENIASKASDKDFLAQCARDNNFPMIQLLLKSKADIKFINEANLLSIASKENNGELFKLLLSHKADPNKKDASKMSATDYAALKENAELLDILTDNGGTFCECAICYKYLSQQAKQFRCDHMFHKECLKGWENQVKKDNSRSEDSALGLKFCCPMCKSSKR